MLKYFMWVFLYFIPLLHCLYLFWFYIQHEILLLSGKFFVFLTCLKRDRGQRQSSSAKPVILQLTWKHESPLNVIRKKPVSLFFGVKTVHFWRFSIFIPFQTLQIWRCKDHTVRWKTLILIHLRTCWNFNWGDKLIFVAIMQTP